MTAAVSRASDSGVKTPASVQRQIVCESTQAFRFSYARIDMLAAKTATHGNHLDIEKSNRSDRGANGTSDYLTRSKLVQVSRADVEGGGCAPGLNGDR